jgi:hypothetical protein
MIIGQWYRRGSGLVQFSPSFPRGGQGLIQNVEVFDNDPGVTMTLFIEHKNTEDTAFLPFGSIPAMGLGINPVSLSGAKEELRYGFLVNGAAPSDSVYANVLPPVWRP